jgi:hypothetical protein
MSCYSSRSAKHPQLATKMMRADAGLHPDEGAHAFPQIPKTFFASARLVHLISCPNVRSGSFLRTNAALTAMTCSST